MNIADLSNYGIPTTGLTRAINALRSDMSSARKFAEVFGVTDADDRITLKAAQVAVTEIFRDTPDSEVRNIVATKTEQHRAFLENRAPIIAPVTVTASEPTPATVEPETNVEPASAEATLPVEQTAEPEVNKNTPQEPTVSEAPVIVKRGRGRPPKPESERKPKYVPTGKGRGRPKFAAGETQYDKCLAFALANGYTADAVADNRSALAIAMNQGIGVPVGSCLVYVGKMLKEKALPATAAKTDETETATEQAAA